MIQKLCKNCFNSFTQYNALNTICPKCSINKYTKRKKPLKKIGPVTKKWIETRNQWMDTNPEPWCCYLCNRPLNVNTLTLDHVTARSRNPSLRNELENLAPCCWNCNEAKGSLSLAEYKAKL